jgi:hypothetical protein
VDAEDYERLCQYMWLAVKREQTWYAYTLTLNGRPLAMHRMIINARYQ